MFKELGQMMSLMRNPQKIQEAMGKMQENLAKIIVEGSAGGDLVKVKVNGRFEVVHCDITEAAMQMNDREMLADLVLAATNVAMGKAREEVAKSQVAMANEMGVALPPGMQGLFPS
ncbi:MAG: YbaB/EbfC family nucleoid-associated protein [Zavarzinella sp.]